MKPCSSSVLLKRWVFQNETNSQTHMVITVKNRIFNRPSHFLKHTKGLDGMNSLDLDSVVNLDMVFKITGCICNVNIIPGYSFHHTQ